MNCLNFIIATSVITDDLPGQLRCSKFPARDCSVEALVEAPAIEEGGHKLQRLLSPEKVFPCILKFEDGFKNVTLILMFAAVI